MSQNVALFALDFAGKGRMCVGMTKPVDRSATQALIQQELQNIAQRIRQAQGLADAHELERAVEAATEVANMAWDVAQILDAEALLHRLSKT